MKIVLMLILLCGNAIAQEATTYITTNRFWLGYTIDTTVMSNMVCSATNGLVDPVQQMIDKGTLPTIVKRLVAEGHVCKTIGHKWTSVPHVTLEYRPDGNYPQYRKCLICDKMQTQKVSEWE